MKVYYILLFWEKRIDLEVIQYGHIVILFRIAIIRDSDQNLTFDPTQIITNTLI